MCANLEPLDHGDDLDERALLLRGVVVARGPLVLLGVLRALVVLVVVRRVEQLPGVELHDDGGPLGEELEASEGEVGERLVLGVGARRLLVGRGHLVGVARQLGGELEVVLAHPGHVRH